MVSGLNRSGHHFRWWNGHYVMGLDNICTGGAVCWYNRPSHRRITNSNLNTDADSDSNRYANGHSVDYSKRHADHFSHSNRHTIRDSHTDGYTYHHSNTNGHAYHYADGHAFSSGDLLPGNPVHRL